MEGVIKMGNIAPRAGFEARPHTLWASVLTITPPRVPSVIMLTVHSCLCGSLPEKSVQAINLVTLEL